MVVKSFIHCADLHLGAKNPKLSLVKQKQLSQEHLEKLEDIFLSNTDVVVICGDLFHQRTVTKKISSIFFDYVKNFNKPVLYVCGNHDEKFEFDILPKNFYILNYHNPVFKTENVDFWCKDADFSNFDNEKINILLLHGEIFNKEDNDFIDVKKYLIKPFDYVALGHQHSFWQGDIDKIKLVYSGATFANGFDECGGKGFVKVDIQKPLTYSFVPVSQREFKIINFDISNIENDLVLKNRLSSIMKQEKDNLVRINLTGYYSEENKPNFNILAFDNFYYEFVDKTKLKIDFQKYKNEPLSFKAEFIKLVEQLECDEEEKNKILTIGLEALQGEDLSI